MYRFRDESNIILFLCAVNKLGEATVALGHFAAPHIKKQSDKVLPKSWQKKDGAGSSKIDSITDVAVGGLQGFRVHLKDFCLYIEQCCLNACSFLGYTD